MPVTLQKVSDTVVAQLVHDYGGASERLKDLCVHGLTEEAGEVAGLRKRQLRHNSRDTGRATREEFVEELGDVLWYLTACCALYDTSLEEIWLMNQVKLEERYGKVNEDCAAEGFLG